MNNKIIQYNDEIIKDVLNLNKILPDDYNVKYNNAFEIIKKSDNYEYINTLLKSMIKISKQKNYSCDEQNKMILISLLNKLTNKNYVTIKNKILNDIIYSYDILHYLCDNIFLKILNDTKYNSLYINLVIDIAIENNLYIDDTNNFITLIIIKCNELYNSKISIKNNFINNIKEEENTNITNYFKNKKILKNYLLFISKLINHNLINKEIIDYILSDLMTECEFRIELLCCFVNRNDIFNLLQKNNINNYLTSIRNNYDSRITYLIDELKIEKEINNKIEIEKEKEKEINIVIENDMKLNNLLNEYLIHKNIKESIKYLKEFIDGYDNLIKDFLYIIFDYDKEKFNNILNLFKNF